MTPRSRARRVAVTSDHALIGEAVSAALAGHGFEVVPVPWPDRPADVTERPTLRPPLPRTPMAPLDGAVLLSDLESARALWSALAAVRGVGAPWVLLTAAPQGWRWGALVDGGVRTVLPSDSSMDQLVTVLEHPDDERHTVPPRLRRELLRAWRAERERREVLRARMASLSPRERSVLDLLYAGDTVSVIAELYQVSEATVRSQVRSVLRKLDTGSQLAAVAAYATYRRDLGEADLAGGGHGGRAGPTGGAAGSSGPAGSNGPAGPNRPGPNGPAGQPAR